MTKAVKDEIREIARQSHQKEIAEYSRRDDKLFVLIILISFWPVAFFCYPLITLGATFVSMCVFIRHSPDPKLNRNNDIS